MRDSIEHDLEKLGLSSGRDEFINYWIVPASKMKTVEILQSGPFFVDGDEDETV